MPPGCTARRPCWRPDSVGCCSTSTRRPATGCSWCRTPDYRSPYWKSRAPPDSHRDRRSTCCPAYSNPSRRSLDTVSPCRNCRHCPVAEVAIWIGCACDFCSHSSNVIGAFDSGFSAAAATTVDRAAAEDYFGTGCWMRWSCDNVA